MVLARLNGAGAMGAADAGVIEVVEWVIGNIIPNDVVPHHFAGPIGKRTDLYQIELRIPIHLANCRAIASLVTANCGHPCIEGSKLAAERLDFAQSAALVRIACPERLAVGAFLVFWSQV